MNIHYQSYNKRRACLQYQTVWSEVVFTGKAPRVTKTSLSRIFENENEAHFSYRSDTSIIDNLSRLGHTLIDTSGVRPKRTVARGRLDPPRVSIDPGGGGKASSP